jgi:alpha-N-arabinofuranosidase
MQTARITLDRDFRVGEVDPRLFGSFVEHLGRCIYGGIYEPDHPAADANGFRTDVLALVRELDVPVVRWPGGNFVSGYHWTDGVGPRSERPRRADLAWKSVETNEFGTDEFVDWCRAAACEPMIAVNLGTDGPEEARSLVEYCNLPGGSHWCDLRRRSGHDQPHNVRLWCLGNEMDGPWQMGHKTPAEYGRLAAETARIMKMVDKSIELVVCGSSGRGMKTFGQWELEVLRHTMDLVEYVSIHAYYGNRDNDTPNFLARPEEMGRFIEETAALCDAVAAQCKSKKRLAISFDEWNVWNATDHGKPKPPDWSVAPPLLECVYNAEDALVVGGMLIQLLNHCDRVKIACQAQLVNVIGLILTRTGGPAWRQSIYWPFLHASKLGRGTVLRQVVETPTYDAKDWPGAPVLTSACVLDEQAGGVTVFAVNRGLDEPLALSVDLRAFGKLRVAEWLVLRHDDLKAVNTADAPETVAPVRARGAALRGGALKAKLPPASWNVIRLAPLKDSGEH